MFISFRSSSPEIIACRSFAVMLMQAVLLAQESRAETPGDDFELSGPLIVSGYAAAVDGTPAPGAKVTLVSTNGIDKKLAETTTNADGYYVFRDVRLPMRKPRRADMLQSGTMQVFAEADGFGIAWHGMRYYHPQPRPDDVPRDAQDHSFYRDDPIEMNITVFKPLPLAGRVVDDGGRPVANVSIGLSTLDYLDAEGREYHHNFREFWAMHFAPPRYREATTDADGRFRFPDLPEETAAVVRVNHPDYASQMFVAANTRRKITQYEYQSNHTISVANGRRTLKPIRQTRLVQAGPLEIQVKATRVVTVVVSQDDDERPAKEVTVVAQSTTNEESSGPSTASSGKTDDAGRVQLRLPPGEYRLVLNPARFTDYVRSNDVLIVADEPREQEKAARLKAGAIVIFEATDAETAAGVAGVTFAEDFEDGRRRGRRGVQSSTTFVDNPVTNDKGELRAVVQPGLHTFSLGFSPPPEGYEFNPASKEQEVECVAGKTVRVRFTLIKK